MSYCQQCAPDQGYMRRKYYDPGPEVLAHLRSSGKNPGAIPPHNPECVVIFAGNRPRIQSPSPSAVYYISRQHPEPILLQCQAGGDAHRVYWYINDRFYKTASPGEKLFYLPAAGPLKIACTDDKGRKDQVRCMVELVDL
jgi:penicillin-binding protein 1C